MSDTTTTAAEAVAASSVMSGDERLAYRGVFQRLFIRPEIGAIIGAVGIWAFFWAVSLQFGTSNGFTLILDDASTLGIMAVAVSMLMIGGEFDLSSGANTGAMGMLVILLSKEAAQFGGAGLNLYIALPISFAVAMAIGYFNGWMVERTKLPSFTITLATFYVLRGSKLGFSKRIVDQIQVGDISNAKGYSSLSKVFAADWERTEHQLGSRDTIYTVAMLLALALAVLAVHEMHFERRRSGVKPAGLIQFLVGVGVAVGGIAALHATDNVSGNVLGGALVGAGVLVGLHGLATWRFEPNPDRGALTMPPAVTRPLLVGVVGVVLAVLSALAWDSDDVGGFFFPWTKQGIRATLMLVFGAAGFTMLMIAAARARRVSSLSRAAIVGLTGVIIAALAFFVRGQSTAVKFRSEAFSVMLVLALLVVAWSLLGLLFEERSTPSHAADVMGRRLLAATAVATLVGMGVKLLFTTDADIESGIANAQFSMRNVWFLVFTAVMVWVLGSTRFGSWTFAVGGNKEASRQVGVPAARTKTQLFMLVSGAAWLVGMLLAFRLHTIQANTGNGLEFDYIIAAVVGGTLLSGGYGTALGGALGAIIVAMARLGIPSSRWNSDWTFLFLGLILLLAVIANRSIRSKAESMRR
jgi:ribose/xylose/arabinose/galactoside ABC-type transport system permease subunit